MSGDGKGMNRRGLIVVVVIAGGLLAGAALFRLAKGTSRTPAEREEAEARPASPAVRAYFGDKLTDGSKLDRWTLVRVLDVHEGVLPVMMASADGQRFKVNLLRRDPAGPRGVAETQQLSLFISN